ncbi:MAG: VWA domain-containing protein [Bryobacteraceae bacterium]
MQFRRVVIGLAALAAIAQELAPIRVTATLVQVDAVVTGRDGRPATGLVRDDFELFLDGVPREIRSVSFVRTGTAAASSPLDPQSETNVPGSLTIRREAVRRSIAVLVDDLKMSFESLHFTREALKKFVAEQVAPGDLVAIMSTSGYGPLQRFTTEKKVMRASIDRLRVNLSGNGPASAVQAIGGGETDNALVLRMLQRRFAVGTLGSIRHIAEGMRDMPGRKSVVLFSEGVRMARDFSKEEPAVNVNDVRRVSDAANLSGVIIYAIDPRGVVYPGLQAKDDVQGLEQVEVLDQLEQRMQKLRGTQGMLRFLAAETGGIAQMNDNDLNGGLQRILEEQSGYYRLEFQPGEAAAERLNNESKYHRVRLKIKRPGLQVRYRKGFVDDTAARPQPPRTQAELLLASLSSPFAENGLRVRFTPVPSFGRDSQTVVRALLHIDGAGVTFGPPDAQGTLTGTLHLVAITEGETANARSATENTFTIRVRQEALENVKQGGFVYALEHKVKEPGAYQMRVAALDALSGKTGSASRFIEVPDLRRGTLAISGITMADGDWRLSGTGKPDNAETDVSPAVRVFRRGNMFSYSVAVYNARIEQSTGQPAVEIQARLILDGRVVWEGKRFPVAFKPGLDPQRIPAGAVLTLGEKTTPGEYVLEVQAIEKGGKHAIVSQWTDFELR